MTDTTVAWATKAARRGYTVAQNVVLFDDRLTPSARLFYFQLAHYAWRDPDAFPTQEELAGNLGVTDRQLRRYAAELEARWLLERRQRGMGKPVEYVLHEPAVDHLERDPRARPHPVENTGENGVEDAASPDAHDRASPDADDRQARTPMSGPNSAEGSEDLLEQEKTRRLVNRRRATRGAWQDVADAVEQSLRRTGGSS